jgi:hypothetical protein
MLIFLDIDGVMVPAKGWKSPELLSDGFPAFSSEACHVLQSLLKDDSTVVLTTSHKSNYTIDEWKQIFKNREINIKNIDCLEKNINNLSRKDEILNWFNAHKMEEDFLIIDDDKSLDSLPPSLKENLILTSPYIGLRTQHLQQISSSALSRKQGSLRFFN